MSRISILELHDFAIDYVTAIKATKYSKEELKELRDNKEAHTKAFSHLQLNSEDSDYLLAEICIQIDQLLNRQEI